MRFVCDCCNDLTNIEADRMEIQGEKLITHTFPLEEYEKAVDIFEHKKENSIKVVIHP